MPGINRLTLSGVSLIVASRRAAEHSEYRVHAQSRRLDRDLHVAGGGMKARSLAIDRVAGKVKPSPSRSSGLGERAKLLRPIDQMGVGFVGHADQ